MYRMTSSLGAAPDLSQWWVRNGFWSKWAGVPPCPSGSVPTSADCQYKGVFAEEGPQPSGATRLDQWLEQRCAAGDYVSIGVPYVDPDLNQRVIAVFAGPGVPDMDRAHPPNTPRLVTYDCQSSPGGGCPKGMVTLPDGTCQMPAPPPATKSDETGLSKGAIVVGTVGIFGALAVVSMMRKG